MAGVDPAAVSGVGAGEATGAPATSLGDVAARGTKVTLFAQLIRFLLLIASLVVLARLLSPADFGIVAMVTSIIGVAQILRDFGLSTAAIQARSLSDAERTNLFWVNVVVGAGCGAIAIACIPLIVALYGEPQLNTIILTLAGVFVLDGATTQFQAELSRELRFTALAITDISAQALGVGTAIVLALVGFGYWSIVIQQVVVGALTLMFSIIVCRWRPGLFRRRVPIGRFFRFGGGVLGTQLVAYVTKNTDNVAIGAAFGAGPLGIYTRAYQLLMTPLNQINAPLTRIALPVLSRVQDDDELYLRYVSRSQLLGCYLTSTIFAVSAGLSVPLVALLFGPRWAGVAPIFAVLAIGGVFRAMDQLAYWIYLSRGLTGKQLQIFLVTGPIMVALMLAGLPWGPIGVAIGCSLGYSMHWAISLWNVGRVAGIRSAPLFATAFRSALLISAPCGLIAWGASLLIDNTVLALVAGSFGPLAYLGLLALVNRRVAADIKTIGDFARRAFRRKVRR